MSLSFLTKPQISTLLCSELMGLYETPMEVNFRHEAPNIPLPPSFKWKKETFFPSPREESIAIGKLQINDLENLPQMEMILN